MILMNEFGDISVDGHLVEDEELAMLEISKGSIFCVCVKTDFIKGLMDIAQRVKPEVLIIEATGVANPSDLRRDLKLSIFQNRFRFREQFCLVDAEFFEDTYDTFTSVEKQIESATVFIINKVDRVGSQDLERVKEIIAKHHPDPEIHETQYARIPLESYLPEFSNEVHSQKKTAALEPVSPQALDAFIDTLIADPGNSMTPPDRLVSVSYTWHGGDSRQFEAVVESIPAGIVRAKGFVQLGSETFLFSYVLGQSGMTTHVEKKKISAINQIVFIGPPEAIDELEQVDSGGRLQLPG
jgi:G3E family GTPase